MKGMGVYSGGPVKQVVEVLSPFVLMLFSSFRRVKLSSDRSWAVHDLSVDFLDGTEEHLGVLRVGISLHLV